MIRIADDPAAADKQLAALEKAEDVFRDKLAKLIADQAKVNAAVEKVTAQYAPLMDQVCAAQIATLDNKDMAAAKLSPEQAKALDAVRKELAGLTAVEQKNVEAAKNLSKELTEMAAQTGKQRDPLATLRGDAELAAAFPAEGGAGAGESGR